MTRKIDTKLTVEYNNELYPIRFDPESENFDVNIGSRRSFYATSIPEIRKQVADLDIHNLAANITNRQRVIQVSSRLESNKRYSKSWFYAETYEYFELYGKGYLSSSVEGSTDEEALLSRHLLWSEDGVNCLPELPYTFTAKNGNNVTYLPYGVDTYNLLNHIDDSIDAIYSLTSLLVSYGSPNDENQLLVNLGIALDNLLGSFGYDIETLIEGDNNEN